ncbi:MAG: cytochrome c3 family protein [Nitrospirota bacterium]|nr:cytochrome c3 family protein [Nitrospirota bacterium]
MKRVVMAAFAVLLSLFFVYTLSMTSKAGAAVTGQCVNCHTMHNSQDGGPVVRDGPGVGWNDSGVLTGGTPSSTPRNKLLVAGCVGCHSSSSSQTIISKGSSNIPIVFNTTVPVNPLAGGNFYWLAQGDDTKGHNVYGIAGTDSNLSTAPGRNPAACSDSCHDTLAAAPDVNNYYRGGCQGCHVFTSHHDDVNYPWYRFLKGHGISPGFALTPDRKELNDYVKGVEDDDWEQETVIDHNYYKGTNVITYTNDGTSLTNYQTITAFCSGCHSVFHGPERSSDGMGSASPWIRHPTDISLPSTGEFAVYDPVTNYSAEAPVAWIDPSSPVRSGATVMCLSCHRPHGSDQSDMLRWDYSNMSTCCGGQDTGCVTCHTAKND